MSAINELVAREYFESLGYLVQQPRKYEVRRKKVSEVADLVIFNPKVKDQVIPEHVVWTSQDLKSVSRAVVGVLGWHTDRIYAATITEDAVRFVGAASVQAAARSLGSGDIARILCVSRLPAARELNRKTLQALKQHGVDGVISFRTMLLELIAGVKSNRNYEKSDLLQIVRILKNYDLLKDAQLELFDGKKRR